MEGLPEQPIVRFAAALGAHLLNEQNQFDDGSLTTPPKKNILLPVAQEAERVVFTTANILLNIRPRMHPDFPLNPRRRV